MRSCDLFLNYHVVKDKTRYEFGYPAPSESDLETAFLYQHKGS